MAFLTAQQRQDLTDAYNLLKNSYVTEQQGIPEDVAKRIARIAAVFGFSEPNVLLFLRDRPVWTILTGLDYVMDSPPDFAPLNATDRAELKAIKNLFQKGAEQQGIDGNAGRRLSALILKITNPAVDLVQNPEKPSNSEALRDRPLRVILRWILTLDTLGIPAG